MTMGASALDLEGLAQVGDDGASLQEAAQASTISAGHLLRLARVRLRTLPACR